MNVAPSAPARSKRQTRRALRVKSAFKFNDADSNDAKEAGAVALVPFPRSSQDGGDSENISPIVNETPSKTARSPYFDAVASGQTVENDALTAFATTVEPDRSFYFSESTESAYFPYSPQPAPSNASREAESTSKSLKNAPSDFPQRSNAPRLTILQRFVKLVAQNRRPDAPSSPAPPIPNDFGENVAFVVSPLDALDPTALPVDASFPVVVDAFDSAPQEIFSHF